MWVWARFRVDYVFIFQVSSVDDVVYQLLSSTEFRCPAQSATVVTSPARIPGRVIVAYLDDDC